MRTLRSTMSLSRFKRIKKYKIDLKSMKSNYKNSEVKAKRIPWKKVRLYSREMMRWLEKLGQWEILSLVSKMHFRFKPRSNRFKNKMKRIGRMKMKVVLKLSNLKPLLIKTTNYWKLKMNSPIRTLRTSINYFLTINHNPILFKQNNPFKNPQPKP